MTWSRQRLQHRRHRPMPARTPRTGAACHAMRQRRDLDRVAQNAARAPAAAAIVSQSALRLPAILEGSSGARMSVDVRLLGPAGDATAASATRGLVATVIGNSVASDVLLDLAGQRLRLAGPRVHLPLGARLALELLPAGGGPPIRDKAGLAGLAAEQQRVVGGGQQPALPPALAMPDATLAARLVADWRALGSAKASAKPALPVGRATIAAEDDPVSSTPVDRENRLARFVRPPGRARGARPILRTLATGSHAASTRRSGRSSALDVGSKPVRPDNAGDVGRSQAAPSGHP